MPLVTSPYLFDLHRLSGYLKDHLPRFSGALEIVPFEGGQSNPTMGLVVEGRRRYVLRRKPPGKLLSSAHAIEREYRVLRALLGTDVPVAAPYCFCEDPTIIGSPFYLMEWVDGRVLWDPALPGFSPRERGEMFDELNRVIASIHSVPHAALGLAGFGKTGSYFQRQIRRWSEQYRRSKTDHLESMERLLEWLPQHIPSEEEVALVHGDYRLDNVVFHLTEPRIVAVLDWELSTLGHPLADFAYHCMTWHIPARLFRGLGGLDLPSLGIPDERAYIDAYNRRTGRKAIGHDDWDFAIAYNLFRLAAILQGVAVRGREGNACSPESEDMGRRVGPLAELAWSRVERIRERR